MYFSYSQFTKSTVNPQLSNSSTLYFRKRTANHIFTPVSICISPDNEFVAIYLQGANFVSS